MEWMKNIPLPGKLAELSHSEIVSNGIRRHLAGVPLEAVPAVPLMAPH